MKRLRRSGFWSCLVVATLVVAAPATAQGVDLRAKVVKKDLPIDIELSGVFQAEDKDEIRIEPDEYKGDLIVTKITSEGASVKTGDVLMDFDKDSLDRALQEARNEVSDAEVELKKAQSDKDALTIEQTASLTELEKELKFATEDQTAEKEKADIQLHKKTREIEQAVENIADAEVDYQQLMELYKERELHTATENILIDREKRRIQNMKISLEVSRKELEVYKKFEHGREIEKKELEVSKKTSEIEKLKIKHAGEIAEKDSAVAKAKRKLEKAKKTVEDLGKDQDALQVVSPRDGIVFYGTTGSDMPSNMIFMGGRNNEMRVGGRVRTHEILMTVASMERLSIKMRVLENDIQHMKDGLPITVTPDAFPALQISGKLTKVDQVASREGFFSEVREFTVKGTYEGVFSQLRAGMNCRVTVHADSIPDAIQVPVVAVFHDDGEHRCYVAASGGGSQSRTVEIGVTNGSFVEIKSGLKPDEEVLLYDPNRGGQ